MKARKTQFGLGSVLVVVLISAILLGWWRTVVQLRQAESQLDEILRSRQIAVEDVMAQPSPLDVLKPQREAPETADEFIAALRQADDWTRFEIDIVRPVIDSTLADEAAPQLIPLLQSPDSGVRERTLFVLGEMKRHADLSVPAIIPLLHDEHVNVRFCAAAALGRLEENARDAVPALLHEMHDDQSPIAAWSGIMLKRIDESVETEPRMLDLLFNGTANNRDRAIEWVRHKGTPEALNALVQAHRTESDPKIRNRMASIIGLMTKGNVSGVVDEVAAER